MLDPNKFINPNQIAGIDSYQFADGPARLTRALCVNTGAGLRYRILVDRGLDIDHAFLNQHSLAFLTHLGPTPPTRALDRGIDWLKAFPGGLLTSCGPFNIGPPVADQGEELGLHGTHSTTAATIESVLQPDPHRKQLDMTVVGRLRYGKLFGPSLELRRTITSTLGQNLIRITDEFHNPANIPAPHAWLLHINFGYPLIDAGAEFCYDARVEPREDDLSRRTFARGKNFKRIPGILKQHTGSGEAVAYLFPKSDRTGLATVGVVNRKLNLGVAIRYSTKEFPRCANWQHFGQREYVAALEPMNGTVAGRDKDRAAGLLDTIAPGASRTYNYSVEALTTKASINELLSLNRR